MKNKRQNKISDKLNSNDERINTFIEMYKNIEYSSRIKSWARDFDIFTSYHFKNDTTYKSIGDNYGICAERARALSRRALRVLVVRSGIYKKHGYYLDTHEHLREFIRSLE